MGWGDAMEYQDDLKRIQKEKKRHRTWTILLTIAASVTLVMGIVISLILA